MQEIKLVLIASYAIVASVTYGALWVCMCSSDEDVDMIRIGWFFLHGLLAFGAIVWLFAR